MTTTKIKKLNVTLEHDPGTDSPNEWGAWKLVSFSNKHIDSENHANYLFGVDNSGTPIPANVGIRRKIECQTAFWLSYYQHSGCVWSLKGEGPQCRWDTAQIAGVLLLEDTTIQKEYREESARGFVEDYTKWANGGVYCYFIEDEDGKLLDSCGGFYDSEQMFEEMRQYTNDADEVEIKGDAKWLADHHKIKGEPST